MAFPFNVTVETPDPPEYTAAFEASKKDALATVTAIASVKVKYAAIVAQLHDFMTIPVQAVDAAEQQKLQHLALVANDYLRAAYSYIGALSNWQENAPIRLSLGLPLEPVPAQVPVPDLTV